MQQDLKLLIVKKDQIQKEIANLTTAIQLIDQTKSLSKGLVDEQGFPRGDLDFGQLANFRNLKRRKAELNNDHLALMKEIQSKLFLLHASYKENNPSNNHQSFQSKGPVISFKKPQKQQVKVKENTYKIDYLTPFAMITVVFEGSPAQNAGLMVQDLVSELGQINIYSLNWQKQLPSLVRENIDIKIKILRKTQEQQNKQKQIFTLKDGNNYKKLQLKLTPKTWQGRGLLGCKIDPL